MKKILPFLILFLASVTTLSQNLHVESLTLDENNLKAQINPKLDVNDKKCCVIMISTPNMDDAQRRKLEFKCDMGAEVAGVDFPTGEIELYVSPHLATLIIAHPDLGKISYDVPIDLKEMKTYNMVLMSAKATTIVEESLTANYLVINVEPKDARVFIDEEFVENKNGAVSKLLSVGVEHSLRIEKNLYHPLDTMVMTNASGTVTVNKKLRPAFGYVEVNSLPEGGATVIINDKEVGVTPYRSVELPSGEYEVRIVKSMFKQSNQTVKVIDGNTTEAKLTMQPNFAEITLTTDSEATIYMDDKEIGRGSWAGRVLAGSHIVEVKKESHRDVKRTITVEATRNQTITLDNPIPICGSLNITSEPIDAIVFLDNEKIGTTPLIYQNVLVGSHVLKLVKQGCATFAKNILVEEGIMLKVDERLDSGKLILITTGRNGDDIYVDGELVGKSPVETSMGYGTHSVKAVRDGKKVEKEIEVKINGGLTSLTLEFGKIVKITTDKKGDDVYVDGKLAGKSPLEIDLAFGNHDIKSVREKKSDEKRINVQKGGVSSVDLYLRAETPTNWVRNGVFFVTVNGAISNTSKLSYGVTIGNVKRFGWFVSAMSSFNFQKADLECDENGLINGYYPRYVDSRNSRLSIMGGFVFRLSGPLCMRVGAGYGSNVTLWNIKGGQVVKSLSESYTGVDATLGLQLNLKGVAVSLDIVTTNFKTLEAKLGIGFCVRNKR